MSHSAKWLAYRSYVAVGSAFGDCSRVTERPKLNLETDSDFRIADNTGVGMRDKPQLRASQVR
jgi:hypothetical protein